MAPSRLVKHDNLKVIYRKRKEGLLKKAKELSILCGIQVLLICISQVGAVDTWPNDAEQVLNAIARYRGYNQVDQDEHTDDLINYLRKQTGIKRRTRDPNRQILADLAQRAASKLEAVRKRIRILTNMSNDVSESNRDEKFEEGVKNNTNPKNREPDSSTVEFPAAALGTTSQDESAANNNVQHQQQYYHCSYPSPERRRKPEDNVRKGGGDCGAEEEEVDTQLRLG